jgi:hypothetical protein
MKTDVKGYVHVRTDKYNFGNLEIWPQDMSGQPGFVFLEEVVLTFEVPPHEQICHLAVEELRGAIKGARAETESRVKYWEDRICELQALPDLRE